MDLLYSKNPSLTIKVLLHDGKNYEVIILLKAKDFYNYTSKFVVSLPNNEEKQDLCKKGNLGITHNLIINLQKLMICHSKDFHAQSWDLRRRLVIVPKLREFVEKDKFPLLKAKFEEEEEIQEEKHDEGENILDNSRIMKMMMNMGYEKGKGLGRQSEGPPAFVLDYVTRAQKHTYGIGYRSTILDDIKQKKIRIEKALAKKNDVPFEVPMRPYPLTLNGQFKRVGDIFPFWGFREREIVATGWDI